MDGQRAQRETVTLDDLLEAGREALALGEKDAAHVIWRQAAVTNPYDERVWSSLMDVLVYDDDREVCLENIIAINPLNTEARRQLRALKRARSGSDDDSDVEITALPTSSASTLNIETRRQQRALKRAQRASGDSETEIATLPTSAAKVVEADSEPVIHEGHSLGEAIAAGVGVGVVAVVLGIIFSIFVYGGILAKLMP